jgi:hypothetical protein
MSETDGTTKQDLLDMEGRIMNRIDGRIDATERRLAAKLDAAANSFAVDVGHLHSENRAMLDRLKKIDANVTTGIELLVRQSRWHDETDTSAVELLVRVNAIEKRLYDLEHR